MSAPSDGARADARKRLGTSTEDAATELRLASRQLLRSRVAMATGHHGLADEARAWDRFALALDAAEDAVR